MGLPDSQQDPGAPAEPERSAPTPPDTAAERAAEASAGPPAPEAAVPPPAPPPPAPPAPTPAAPPAGPKLQPVKPTVHAGRASVPVAPHRYEPEPPPPPPPPPAPAPTPPPVPAAPSPQAPPAPPAAQPAKSPTPPPAPLTPIDKLPPATARGRVAPVPPSPTPPPPPAPPAPPPTAPPPTAPPVAPTPAGRASVPAPPARAYVPAVQQPIPPAPVEPAGRTGRRLLWVGLVLGVVVLVGLGAGLVVLRPAALFGPRHAGTATVATPPEPAPSPVLAAAPTDGPVPSADSVAAALSGPLADSRLGGHVGIQVVDAATGQKLFGRDETDAAVPASTMKLVTTTAVLATLGPAAQLRTRAVAGTNPGEVVLVGGGDPTLAVTANGSYPGAARLDDLAGQVKKALGGVPPTKVIVDASLFTGPTIGPNWEPGVADAGGYVARVTALMVDGGRTNPKVVDPPSNRTSTPDVFAGQSFARLLGLPPSAVTTGRAPAGGSSAGAGGGPAPGTQLGVVSSPPVVRLLELMLEASDNTIAEVLARQVAIAAKQPASFAGEGAALLSTLSGLGLPTDGASISDGSGLSFDDRLTPRLLTGVLGLATRADRPELHALVAGLPVAGYSGTLAERFRTPSANPADGVVRAKTGTLPGVNALAGYVTTTGGRLLAFAVLADRVTVGIIPAEAALDRVGTALAQLS